MSTFLTLVMVALAFVVAAVVAWTLGVFVVRTMFKIADAIFFPVKVSK